ncbi:MAG: RNA 2',3'-cyclic phosphodiesterase [Elusimicrobia bacterium]|nr:RNA 2',3'-cyclic phosphodiesterase [Elusimicrobiota bacterium]
MLPTARLFIAVPAADEVRRAAARLIAELRLSGADFKWVEPENLHLTLRFFGATPLERLPEIESLMGKAARRPRFAVSFGPVGAFNSWEDPKVLWVGVGQGAAELAALAESLGASAEGRPFSAHLTIGRRRGRGGGERLKAAARRAGFPELRQEVDRIVLFESRLTAQGPAYSIRKEESFLS